MDRYYVTLEGPPVWQITVAVLVALWLNLISRWALDRVSDWWYRQRSTVEDAAPADDGPVGWPVEPEGWKATPPADLEETTAASLSEYRWWLSPSGGVHLAGCKQMRRGMPWAWPETLDEAIDQASEQGLRACRHCDPFGERAGTGELEAVS